MARGVCTFLADWKMDKREGQDCFVRKNVNYYSQKYRFFYVCIGFCVAMGCIKLIKGDKTLFLFLCKVNKKIKKYLYNNAN